MSVVDLGAGPGFITGELLDTLPSSQVTSLEIDPVMIERAEKYLGLPQQANHPLALVK